MFFARTTSVVTNRWELWLKNRLYGVSRQNLCMDENLCFLQGRHPLLQIVGNCG